MDPIFNEKDLKSMFENGTPAEPSSDSLKVSQELLKPQKETSPNQNYNLKKDSIFKTISKFFGIFLLLFIISFTIINSGALIQKFKYFYETEFRNQSWATNTTIPKPVMNQSRIIIPKIRVDAPVSWNVEESKMSGALENGVAHYLGTALPGQTGNVFITGHSSYYIWSKGNYKTVFALLDKLEAGDKVYVQFHGANFIYQITNKKVVTPSNLTVLNQTTDKTLSLMTCVPVGTNLQRLIVTAKQISE